MNYNYIIKLGNANTTIVKAGEGVLLHEPSVVAVSSKDMAFKASGNMAYKAVANSDTLELVSPIADGVIKNKQLATCMLKSFLKQIGFKNKFAKNNVVLLIPSSIDAKEKNEYVNVAYSCMFTNVSLLPSILVGMVDMEIRSEEHTSELQSRE